MARGAIAYKGQLYLGGSKVEANPTGSAEGGNLSKLGVDDTVYAIPQVNNGTLTIQKNGTNVATFSANQSGNVTANIDVSEDIAGTKTVSGNPITLTDCAPINAESLVVELLPKQDLHGQQYPYVGGAGKNKLPMTVDGIKAANTDGTWSGNVYSINNGTFTVITDDGGNVTGIKVNGAFNADVDLFLNSSSNYLSSNDTMILNGCPSGGSFDTSYSLVLYSTSSGGGYPMADEDTGSGAQNTEPFINGAVAIKVVSGYTASNIVFYPMIRLSTETDPTFAPYSNICPITGYTECEVDDVGKNILEPTAQTQTINQVTFTKNSDGTYTVNGTASEATFFYPCGQYASFDMNGKTISGCPSGGSTGSYWFSFSNSTEAEFDTGNGAAVTREVSGAPVFVMLQGASLNNAVLKPMICSSSAENPTAYEPYQSSNATIQFGQTVYGGIVDFNTGVVTITDANIASYAGETLPSTWISDRDAYSSGGTPTTGAQVVYKLSTPTTLQLTPQELKLLKGTNNLSTNGTTINLDYIPNNSIGDAVKASEEYTDRRMNALGDLAYIDEDGDNSTKFLRGDGTWQNTPAGVTTLAALTDTTISSPSNGQVLKYNGSKWVNSADYSLPKASASVLGGVKVGTNLSIDANGVLSATGGGGATALNDLNDVSATSPQNKQVLAYDSSQSKWVAVDADVVAIPRSYWSSTTRELDFMITVPAYNTQRILKFSLMHNAGLAASEYMFVLDRGDVYASKMAGDTCGISSSYSSSTNTYTITITMPSVSGGQNFVFAMTMYNGSDKTW